jgi:hypothetical protein
LLVPEQKLLVIPEPPEPHVPGFLFVREHEIVRSLTPADPALSCSVARHRVSGLGCLVRLVG